MSVFLSASFPTGARGAAVEPYRTRDIASAATATVEAVLRHKFHLLFGGHPTITPIVHQVAFLLDAGPLVHLFQSEWFAEEFPPEARALRNDLGAELVLVPAEKSERESVLALRQRMLAEPVEVAFFIGGMSGILEEFNLVREGHPEAVINLFHYPGGMAARLVSGKYQNATAASAHDVEIVPRERGRLRILLGRAYPYLASSSLNQ